MEKLLVVLGPTGAGKSQLAIDIATHFGKENCEIINADVCQCYKGLDISTNKPTKEELNLIQHHLVGNIPIDQHYTVFDFQKDAAKCITEINNKKKIPILCGGSNLYIEAVVFDTYFNDDSEKLEKSSKDFKLGDGSFEDLKKFDEKIYQKVHPNDERKIGNYLNIIENKSIKPSGIYEKKRKLKYDCYFIWLSCEDKKFLYDKLDARVEKMIKRGMIDEFIEFNKIKNEKFGILQSIGFKEFEPYIVNLPNEDEELFKTCVESLQRNTRQYARKQMTWFKNNWASDQSILIESKNLVEIEFQNENKVKIGIEVFNLLRDGKTSYNIKFVEEPKSFKDTEWKKYKCDVCFGRLLNGNAEYQAHIKSKLHKSNLKKSKKIEK
eukprot:gene1393-12013_t